MNTSLTTTFNDDTGLPKWQQPEKMAGRVFLVGLAGTAEYFWGSILPFLVDMVFDSMKLGIGMACCSVCFYWPRTSAFTPGYGMPGSAFGACWRAFS